LQTNNLFKISHCEVSNDVNFVSVAGFASQ
jgi:hypothetical protein